LKDDILRDNRARKLETPQAPQVPHPTPSLEWSRFVRVGSQGLRHTKNFAATHRKHPRTLVPALRSNTAFGVPDGHNRVEHVATLSVHKSDVSSYRLTHKRPALRGPPIRP
jgi:hypothetical protein